MTTPREREGGMDDRVKVDRSAWPLVHFELAGAARDADVEYYVGQMAEDLAREEPYVMVLDMRRVEGINAAQRGFIAQWLAGHRAELARYRLGLASIPGSAIMKGVLTAVYWLNPPPYPYVLCSTEEEALDWAKRQLGEQ